MAARRSKSAALIYVAMTNPRFASSIAIQPRASPSLRSQNTTRRCTARTHCAPLTSITLPG
jgi:hypothetical protein